MNTTKNISGFTLIEVIVSITIFSLMLTAVISIFLFASGMSARVEINRSMQENIKNVLEDIAEEIRISEIRGVIQPLTVNSDCAGSQSGASITGIKLCLTSGTEYALGYYDDTVGIEDWTAIRDPDDCILPTTSSPNKQSCRIIKRVSATTDYFPLTNSLVSFDNIQFIVTNTDIPKLTVHTHMRPSISSGVNSDLIDITRVDIQTTISERLIDTN